MSTRLLLRSSHSPKENYVGEQRADVPMIGALMSLAVCRQSGRQADAPSFTATTTGSLVLAAGRIIKQVLQESSKPEKRDAEDEEDEREPECGVRCVAAHAA
jgi:hypothetical protein